MYSNIHLIFYVLFSKTGANWRDNINWSKEEREDFESDHQPLKNYMLSNGSDHVKFFKLLRRMLQFRPTDRPPLGKYSFRQL